LQLGRHVSEGRQYLSAIGDLPLGINPDAAFSEVAIRLEKGDRVILYTDGITEAKNSSGQFFDTSGLEAAVSATGEDPEDLIQRIKYALWVHGNGVPAGDDQTIVAMQVM